MSILPAGTFRVSNYRKPMPERVKRAAIIETIRRRWYAGDIKPEWLEAIAASAATGELEFDHRPPLQDRPYDTAAGDFVPPQNDPRHIDAVPGSEHLARSVGAPGRPERGDADRRKRVRSLANKTEAERAARAAKAGQVYTPRADIPPPTKKSRRPKMKIRGRANWPWGRKIAKRAKPWGRK